MIDQAGTNIFDITASALAAERQRLAVISQNIANAQVTRTKGGGPYRRQTVTFESVLKAAKGKGRSKDGIPVGGVRARIGEDPTPFERVKMKGHPDADKDDFVSMPNVNVLDEMVDMLDASRTYEANLSALRTYRQMLQKTLEMTR